MTELVLAQAVPEFLGTLFLGIWIGVFTGLFLAYWDVSKW